MSYARFGWDGSDVYVIGTASGPEGPHFIECCGCRLVADMRAPSPAELAEIWPDAPPPWCEPGTEFDFAPYEAYAFPSGQAAYAHMEAHIAAGHHVPQYCLDRIREDDWVPWEGA